jgi:hypothetical protein
MAPPLIMTPQKTGDLTRALRVTYGRARKRVNSWAYRVLGGLDVSTTETQIVWPEMTIQEFDRGPMGDDITYQTIKWVDRLVSVEAKGVAFRMHTYQDNDLQRANAIRSVGVFGDQCGFKAATYDMRGVKYTLQNGEDAALVTARKGGALFRREHPIGGASTGTFDNLFEGLAFNPLNLGAIVAYISQIDDGTGEPEDAEPTVFTLLPNNYKMRSDQMSNAEILKDAFGTQNAASNTFYKGPYGFDEPIISAHMGNEPDTWYVFVDWGDMPEEAPLNRMELEGWNLVEFAAKSELELAKSESFEVHHKARIGFAGGNPKKVFKIKASGDASNNDTKLQDIIDNM